MTAAGDSSGSRREKNILWWPPAKVFVSPRSNALKIVKMRDAFVHLVMRLISRSMKRHLLNITGKLAHKKMLESHNIYVLVLILFGA